MKLKLAKHDVGQCTSQHESIKNIAVIQYVHGLSHRFKKVGAKFGISFLFSTPNKLGKVGAVVKRIDEGMGKRVGCKIKHQNKFVPCKIGVVYHIPLSCSRAYVRQTGRCVNARLLEHQNSLPKKLTWQNNALNVAVHHSLFFCS